ncbi:hypothetical protein Salpa_2330 [Sporomusa sp. KB1]|nr:hypothetical protein Salpa_2330 [Sporomusa sp. KB1]
MPKQMICNVCLTTGNIVPMQVREGYFYCTECRNESWPDREGTFVDRWNEQQKNAEYRSCSLQEGVKIQGGSSKNGKSSKERMKKKSVSVLNAQLFNG